MKNQSLRAMVTGASSGIGREFAEQLARQGFEICAVARREEKLQELITELPGEGHTYIAADLADQEQLGRVASALQDRHYSLLVNNAGRSVLEPFYKSDLGTQRGIMDTNCNAVITLAHAFLSQAKAGDALINMASIVSFLPTPAQPVYSASKAFMASFSECLWEENRERDVYVMGLCPGVTQTEFISGATGGDADGQTLPAALIQTTDQVVSEALCALEKRAKAIVVTGWINRVMLMMPRVMSRHRLLKVLAVIGDPNRAL